MATLNLIDRVVGWFNPIAGVQRVQARNFLNSYKGGVSTRTSEGFPAANGFRFHSSETRQEILSARDRAYQAFRNNPVARTLIQTEVDNVIGDGLNYQPASSSEAWNAEAKDRYYQWLENASVRGQDIQSGCEFQRMAWERSRVAGDCGWLLVADGIESRVQLIPSENIVTPDGKYSDRNILDGIQFDALRRPINYFILAQDEDTGKRTFATAPARDFVYLAHMTDPAQVRGESAFITIFDLLSHLDRYVDGVSLAAWMATVFGIVFKGQSSSKQFSGLPTVTNSQGTAQRAITFENGSVKYLAPEDEVVQVDAKQPMQQTPEFIRTMFRMLGQPFDMPLEVIAKDMSTCTFASARIGLLPFYRSCRIKAARFGSRWSRTIRWWLSREALRPDGDPKKWKTAFPPDYWNHELLPNAWDYTDPVSEVQSDMLQVDAGFKSVQMVMSERGRDGEAIIRERHEWKDKTDGLPETRSTMSRDAVAPGVDGAPAGPDPELERIKARADAFGVCVRAGVITPQTDDENQFRSELALPPMSGDAIEAWEKDKGVRRPITITPPGGTSPAPFGGQPQPTEDDPEDDNEDPTDE